jgi:hypothetical protein
MVTVMNTERVLTVCEFFFILKLAAMLYFCDFVVYFVLIGHVLQCAFKTFIVGKVSSMQRIGSQFKRPKIGFYRSQSDGCRAKRSTGTSVSSTSPKVFVFLILPHTVLASTTTDLASKCRL